MGRLLFRVAALQLLLKRKLSTGITGVAPVWRGWPHGAVFCPPLGAKQRGNAGRGLGCAPRANVDAFVPELFQRVIPTGPSTPRGWLLGAKRGLSALEGIGFLQFHLVLWFDSSLAKKTRLGDMDESYVSEDRDILSIRPSREMLQMFSVTSRGIWLIATSSPDQTARSPKVLGLSLRHGTCFGVRVNTRERFAFEA